MSSLLSALADVFIFLMEIVLDILCAALWACSLVGFWRWPFIHELKESSGRKWFRVAGAANFGTVMLDILVLPFLCITLCSWRSVRLLRSMASKSDAFYCLERRGYIMLEFGLLLFDIPFIVMLLFAHATFWRIPFLWSELFEEMGKSGITLCNSRYSDGSSKFREIIAVNALNGFVDIFLLPFALVVLLTGYRIRRTIELWEKESKLLEKKVVIIGQCLLVFADVPFALMGVLTLLLCIRAKPLIEDLKRSLKSSERRLLCAMHFGLSFRDLLCIPLLLPLLVSVYRLYFCVRGIVNAVSAWDVSPSMIVVRRVTLELPEARGKGIIVKVEGTKRCPSFELTSASSVSLYIRNGDFWESIGSEMGAAVAAIGQTLLPLSIAPKYFDVAQIKALPHTCEGGHTGEFAIDFNTATCKTIRKNANKLRGATADIQIEYDGAIGVDGSQVSGTLLSATVVFSHFNDYVDNNAELNQLDIPSKYTSSDTGGQRFCDVFWTFAVMEFGYLLFDLVCLVFLCLLHLFPHRVYRVYSTACQGSERKAARSKVEAAHAFREFLIQQRLLFFRIVSNCDEGARQQLRSLKAPASLKDEERGMQFPYERRRYYRPVDSSAEKHEENIRKLLLELGTRKEKLQSAGCREVLDALVALDAFTAAQSVSLKETYKHHFCNETPFVDFFTSLGMSAEEQRQVREATHAPQRTKAAGQLASLTADDEDEQFQRAIAESLFDDTREHTAPLHHEDSQLGPYMDNVQGESSLNLPSYSEPFPTGERLRPADLLSVWSTAMKKALQETDSAIRSYEAEFSRSPWTGGKEGWGGVRKVVVEEVGMLMYDTVALLAALMVVCTLYRVVPLLRSLPEVNNVRRACLLQVVEIGIDLWYILKSLLVFVFVKGAVSLPSDLMFYLLEKPSFDVARQIVDFHLRSVLEDLVYILSLVVAWDTIRFALATAVFGVFSPCVVLEGAFARWDGSTSQRNPEWSTCMAAFLLLLSSCWVIGVPVFVGYYVAQHDVADAPAAVFFSIMGFVLYLGLGVSVVQCDEAVVSIRRNAVRCLTMSMRYAGIAIAQILDTVQLLALVFQVSRPDMYGATIGGGLEQASNYVFGTFGATWTSLGVPFGTYLALVLAIMYFIVSGAPVVCGDMLHWRKGSFIVQSPAWAAAMTFLGQTCMLTVVRNISLLYACEGSTLSLTFSTVESPQECWRGPLKSLTVFASILLTYYVPTSLMKNQKFNAALLKSVDVVFPQLYLCLTRLPIATCCVLCTVLYEHRVLTLCIVLVTMVWCVAITVVYPYWLRSPHCSVRTLGWYRFVQYAGTAVVAALVLAQKVNTNADGSNPSYWSLYAVIAVIVAALVSCTAIGIALTRRTRAEEDTIEDVKQSMARARQQLVSLGAIKTMPGESDASGAVFAKRLAQATRCSELAALLIRLESECYATQLSPIFLSTRMAWEKKTRSVMDEHDRRIAMDVDWYRHNFPRYVLCCECCRDVNSHNRRNDDDAATDTLKGEDDRLIVLQEVCMALCHAASCR